jgi:excisionase family DNA binding protein
VEYELDRESSITISEASHILGVSEVALRQWTDEGKVKAFITPGGHRRYSKAALKQFMGSSQKMLGIKDLIFKLEDSVHIHRDIDRSFLNSASLNTKLSKESQEQMAALGRQILNVIIRYIAEPSNQDEIIKLGREAGREFGELLARLELPLIDSIQVFIAHRNPIMSTVTQMMSKREGFTERIVGAMPLVDRILDEALLSLVTAHQQSPKVSQHIPKGECE